jgi:hypothetical protein
MATEPARTYPSELPVIALRETVVFPADAAAAGDHAADVDRSRSTARWPTIG